MNKSTLRHLVGSRLGQLLLLMTTPCLSAAQQVAKTIECDDSSARAHIPFLWPVKSASSTISQDYAKRRDVSPRHHAAIDSAAKGEVFDAIAVADNSGPLDCDLGWYKIHRVFADEHRLSSDENEIPRYFDDEEEQNPGPSGKGEIPDGWICKGTADEDYVKALTPFEDPGACPFEACTYARWTAVQDVMVLKGRRLNAQPLFLVRKGEQVQAVTGVAVTIKPGVARAKMAIDILRTTLEFLYPGNAPYIYQDRPNINRRLRGVNTQANVGDTLELLTYRGEGFFKVRFKGIIMDDVNISGMDSPYEALAWPQSDWWVKIRNAEGLTGWTRGAGGFTGADRYGG